MNIIPILEHQEYRVLTTKQIADFYGVDTAIIIKNFNRNQDRFIHGKHHFLLEGQDLKRFVEGSCHLDMNLKFSPKLMIWTEKGAMRHAKILNTDKAWDVFEELEETYFRVKELAAAVSDLPLSGDEDIRLLKATMITVLERLHRLEQVHYTQTAGMQQEPSSNQAQYQKVSRDYRAERKIPNNIHHQSALEVLRRVRENERSISLKDFLTKHNIRVANKKLGHVTRKVVNMCNGLGVPVYAEASTGTYLYPEHFLSQHLSDLKRIVEGYNKYAE